MRRIPRRISKSLRPFLLETLESRRLLCDVGCNLSTGGVLEVTGGDNADAIGIVMNPNSRSIEIWGDGHVIDSFPASSVRSVKIFGLGGDDLISLDARLSIPTLIDGGDGQDTVLGIRDSDVSSAEHLEHYRYAVTGVELFGRASGIAAMTFEEESDDDSLVSRVITLGHDHAHGHTHPNVNLSHSYSHGISSGSEHTMSLDVFEPLTSTGLRVNESHTSSAHGSSASHSSHAATTAGAEAGLMLGGLSPHHTPSSSNGSSYDPTFSARSIYKGECPSSKELAGATMSGSGSFVTVDPSAGGVDVAKVGCQCLAMRNGGSKADSGTTIAAARWPDDSTDAARQGDRNDAVISEGSAVSCCSTLAAEEQTFTAIASCCQTVPAVPTPEAAEAIDQALVALSEQTVMSEEASSDLVLPFGFQHVMATALLSLGYFAIQRGNKDEREDVRRFSRLNVVPVE